MSNIRALSTDPCARHIETPNADWIISGSRVDVAANRIDSEGSFQQAVDAVTKLPGEYSLLRVATDGSPSIEAHRGITSSYDWYWTTVDETAIIGDHFREVLAAIPVEERTVAEGAAEEQLLLGTRPREPYVEEVDRLMHGETLRWEPIDDDPDVRLTERLPVPNRISPAEAKRRLDKHFDTVLSADLYEEPATLLSGGVDSSLMQTYLQTTPTVGASYSTPELQPELEYSLNASDLLRTDHYLRRSHESRYLDDVERTTEATGLPLQHYQIPVIHRAVAETPHQTYFSGQLAEIFGFPVTLGHRIAWLTRHVNRVVPNVDHRIEWLKTSARGQRRPATDPGGTGSNFVIHASRDLVAKILGNKAVSRSKLDRLEYLKRRIPVYEALGFAPHMHVGHFIHFFQENTVSRERSLAHANGKSMQTPFAGKEVLKVALALSPEKRYIRGKVPKYILKDMLEARLPAYDAHKKKLSGGFPEKRFQEEGPLSTAFERYPMPEFIPEEFHGILHNSMDRSSWNALAYAVWRDSVLKNADFDHYESTRILER